MRWHLFSSKVIPEVDKASSRTVLPSSFTKSNEGLVLNGQISSTELSTGSGKGYHAYFCINCGVYLYCKYNIANGRLAVRTSTLEKTIIPEAHIFLKDKDPWIEISNKEICHQTMYDREKTWPKESLTRLKEKESA